MFYNLIETNAGWVGIAGEEGAIARLILPKRTREEVEIELRASVRGSLENTDSDFSGEAERLVAYFLGERVDFECRLEPEAPGDFDLLVWRAAQDIRYGEIRSYGWIADRIGRPNAARAVGQALGRNPILIVVPCHRVLRADGGLGGFNCGLDWKRRLLSLEGNMHICT